MILLDLSSRLLHVQRMLAVLRGLLGVRSTMSASLLLCPRTNPTLEHCIGLGMRDRTYHFGVLWELGWN